MLVYLWPKDDWNIKARVGIALSLLVAGKILNINVPLFFKQAVDSLNMPVHPDATVLTVAGTVLIGYGAAKLGAILFQEMRNAIFAKVAQRAIRAASRNIFYHVQNLDLSFHMSSQTGGLIRAIDRGSKGINQILSSVVFHVVPTAFEISLVSYILSSGYGIEYAAVALATMAVYTAFTLTTTSWRIKFRRQMNAADNQAAATATDSLLNYEAVKYFNNEAYEMEKYDKSLAKYEKAAMRTASSLAFLNAGQNAIFSIALASMMWMASGQIINGALTVGDLVFINGLVFQLSTPLNFLGSVYRETRQSLMDMDAMFKLQSVESRIRDAPDAIDLDPSRGYEIKFENVSFGYTETRPILKNVSFTIPTGHSVAFVGPSGCGKSTIIRLLFRFYDPDGGRITINGHDIRQISLKSLRQALGVLPQDTILFNQTIYQNISYGNPGTLEERVYRASEMANLHNRISTVFPDGYETMVGERGMMISGGEKQRVQLARVFLKVGATFTIIMIFLMLLFFLKDPPVILFDEPTSALDQATENSIMTSIWDFLASSSPGLSTPRSSIFIAHRLSTIKECDTIVVLKEGQVIEKGGHEALLDNADGLYRAMWKAQQEAKH